MNSRENNIARKGKRIMNIAKIATKVIRELPKLEGSSTRTVFKGKQAKEIIGNELKAAKETMMKRIEEQDKILEKQKEEIEKVLKKQKGEMTDPLERGKEYFHKLIKTYIYRR